VNWRIFATDASQPDFDRLSDEERAALADDLFGWVESGPPRANRRVVGGLDLFEDRVRSGFTVTYFVDDLAPYVAILRVRAT
jgi:hypothetical protein